MNTVTGAEAAVRLLQHHGVQHIFGLCRDTSLPFYDALARLDHGMDHVLTRDERSAAYMADAYARVTGRVGVCEGPSDGGATYILPGVVEANESSVALLSITSDVPVTARGRYPLTALDQKALFAPLTKWNAVVDEVSQIPHLFRTAFRAATTGRPGATHIGLPYVVQKQDLDADDLWANARHGTFPAFRTAPDPDLVVHCAEVILASKKPAFVCGGGVIISGASEELIALAELLDAPVASTVSGHGVIQDDHPLAVGVVGANGGTTWRLVSLPSPSNRSSRRQIARHGSFLRRQCRCRRRLDRSTAPARARGDHGMKWKSVGVTVDRFPFQTEGGNGDPERDYRIARHRSPKP